MYVRVIRPHNETFGWHVRAGRVTHVVDLDPTVARPHRASRRRRREGGRPSRDPTFPRHRRPKSTHPKKSRQNLISVSRRCVKTLRGQERPVDCGDTGSRFRRRGVARARATPRERIGSAGRCDRGGRAPRRRNRARRLSQAGEVRKNEKEEA